MKDLFKSIERLCRSGKTQVGSNAEGVIVVGGLSKKYLTRCQILRSKDYLSVLKKLFFNLMKDLFKSIERLRRSGQNEVGSKAEEIIVLGGLSKRYLSRCQILRSKDFLYTV